MEIDWGGKPNYTSYGCPMANWRGHETHNPNHMNESLLSEVDWEHMIQVSSYFW